MKAKYYIGIAAIMIAATVTAKGADRVMAEAAGNIPGKHVGVTAYHVNYDFHYASRIKRFHSSYTAFTFYSPVYTEAWWYTNQPYTWGVSIYAGGGFGYGYSFGYPAYYPSYYGGWDNYYPVDYYWGYNPGWSYWSGPAYYSVKIKYKYRYNINNYYYTNYHNNRYAYNDRYYRYNNHNNYNHGYSSKNYPMYNVPNARRTTYNTVSRTSAVRPDNRGSVVTAGNSRSAIDRQAVNNNLSRRNQAVVTDRSNARNSSGTVARTDNSRQNIGNTNRQVTTPARSSVNTGRQVNTATRSSVNTNRQTNSVTRSNSNAGKKVAAPARNTTSRSTGRAVSSTVRQSNINKAVKSESGSTRSTNKSGTTRTTSRSKNGGNR
ncbi:MAG: hypothetical protein ABR519_00280 [Bacteroidales bacterium]